MLLSFLLSPLNMIALGLVQPLALLALLTFTQGLLTDLYRPAVSAAIADLVPPEDRPRAFGYLYWAINLGFAIAPVVAGLMARFDYFLLFVGDAATTFAFGLIVLAGVRETRPAEAHAASKAPLRQRIGQLRSSPLMLLFCALALGFGIIYMQANVTLPVDMASHGLGPEQYGLAIAVNGVLIVLLGLPASHAAGRWPRYGAMAVAALLAGAGFGLTGLASTLLLFGLSIGVWTLGEIAASTIAPAIVADLSPVELRGLFQGAFGAAWGLSAFAGPLLGGWVYQRFGAGALWSGCLTLGAFLTLGYLALGRRASRAGMGASMARAPSPPPTPLL